MAQWVRRGEVVRNMNWYTVKLAKGDSLQRVASSVTPAQSVDYIMKWNGLSSQTISAAITLKVYSYYTVQWGDTLSDVAKSFGTTYQALMKINPQIKNANLIYPNDKIRLMEGREPEENPPKPATAPPKPAATTAKAATTPPTKITEEPKRNQKANDYWEDDFPAHRLVAGDYFLRLGDCQFVIPPEFIQVNRVSNVDSSSTIRQKDSFKKKDGHSTVMVQMQLWFNNLEEINGFEVTGPISGQKYYMDGLRPLIAQLKRMPFVPVENEFLNDVMDIYVLALSNITFTTVPGFPRLIQANLTFYKADMTPIIERPNWAFDQMIMYPMFRWYYQQMLVTTGAVESTTHLMPITNATYNNDVKFKILNEGMLREMRANYKIQTAELEDMGYDDITLPDDLICTQVLGSLGTMLSPMQMDMTENATFQYLGSIENTFQLTFETKNADSIAILERLYQTMERYSRMYRDKIVTGYIGVQNALINMCGIAQSKELFSPCMITDMTVYTIPGGDQTFGVQMSLVSFRHTQKEDERAKGFNIISTEDAEAIAHGTFDMNKTKNYSYTNKSPFFLMDEAFADSMLDGLELYPDLELPIYKTVNHVRKKIDDYRKSRGQSPLPIIGDYMPPYQLYREYGKSADEGLSKRRLSDSLHVDPDFYMTYPPLEELNGVDLESMGKSLGGISLANVAETAVPGTTAGGPQFLNPLMQGPPIAPGPGVQVSDMPTASQYVGPAKFKSRIAGTDKWNDKIFTISNKLGIDPILTKTVMMKESSGQLDTVSNDPGGSIGYGLMQVTKFDYNKNNYDWNRMLTDADYAITCGVQMLAEKAEYVRTLSKKGDSRFMSGPTAFNVLWAYNGISDQGKAYAQEAIEVYNGLKGGGSGQGTAFNGSGPTDATVIDGASLTMPTEDPLDAILQFAEADIITPIPKNNQEAHKVVADTDNPNILMKSMMHDMKKFSKRGSLMRCFPTYVLMFVDEGVWVDYRRLWNNYWTYHSVQEIHIAKERNQPVDTAIISLQNNYGALNYKDKALYSKANKAATAPEWTDYFQHPNKSVGYWWDVWFPTVSKDMVQLRMKYAENSGMLLKPGARVHIRLGYGSVASQMPVVFNGKITELSTGDVVQAVCQSDALEMTGPFRDWTNGDAIKWWHWQNDPQEILTTLLTDRAGPLMLDGLNALIYKFSDRWSTSSKFGIEHFGTVLADTKGNVVQNFFGWGSVLNGYDAIKNIYATNSQGTAGLEPEDDEKKVTFWLSNKSPWDVFQYMSGIAPGFESKIHEHGLHSTIFFGEPHWYMKYKYINMGSGQVKEDYYEALKASQQYHKIDSGTDIIMNAMRVSSEDITTVVVPMYTMGNSQKAGLPVWLDPNIKPEMQRTEVIDTTARQNFFDFGTSLVDKGVEFFENIWGYDTKTQQDAENVARRHMQVKLREMYQGEIVIMGDTAIRPGDLVSVADSYNQIFGHVEVGRIVHSLSFNDGFISTIKPDLVTFREDSQRAKILPPLLEQGLSSALWGITKLARMYVLRKPLRAIRVLDRTAGFIKAVRGIRAIGAAGIAAEAAAGPPGWVAIVVELALWVAIEMMINGLTRMLTKRRARLSILPVWYKNQPYVAGIDGHRELIPGQIDFTMFPDEAAQMQSQLANQKTELDISTLPTIMVPEGNTMVYPLFDFKTRVITTKFGAVDSVHSKPHTGTDIAPKKRGVAGEAILAAMTGTVLQVKKDFTATTGYGGMVILQHDPTKGGNTRAFTLYGHMRAISVSVGQHVNIGDKIGEMGTSGHSTGVHLHLEVRTGKASGSYYDAKLVDPEAFLQAAQAFEAKGK